MRDDLPRFPGRLGIQQRVLPDYRGAFFDLVAGQCEGGLELFAGDALPIESIHPPERLEAVRLTHAENRHLFDPRHPLYLCWQSNLLAWLEATQPDLLVVEANPRSPRTRQALAWMRERGRPCLGWGLGAPPLSGKLAFLRDRQRRSLLARVDGMICYSERAAAEYRAMGVPRTFVAKNAVAARPTTAMPARSPEIEGPVKALFVGRIQERKRLDDLFRVCAALPEALRPELTVVGDGPARARFEADAKATYPRTRFVGAQHGEALAASFAAADLFVLPGTGGLAVQQAMSHALPIVVGQGDGTQDDLVTAENGWQFPPGDTGALSACLEQALSRPGKLRAMGAASYRIVTEEVNLETMATSYLQACCRTLAGG